MPPRMLSYRWFAKVYGWTPDQVDNLPEDAFDWFPVIEEAEQRAAEIKQREAQRESGGRTSRHF